MSAPTGDVVDRLVTIARGQCPGTRAWDRERAARRAASAALREIERLKAEVRAARADGDRQARELGALRTCVDLLAVSLPRYVTEAIAAARRGLR